MKIPVANPIRPPYEVGVIKAAIFDLDGTLVDSLSGIAASLNRALSRHGYEGHELDKVRSFIGNGSWMLCRRGVPSSLPDTEADAVNTSFMEDYDRTWQQGTELFAGIADLLAELKRSTMPLAVLSNKPDPFTVDIVSMLFAPETFDEVLGHRAGTRPKPDPSGATEIAANLQVAPADIAVIGDSLVDFETARNASMHPLLVNWGYRPTDELRASGAPLLNTTNEVLEYLQGNHGS